MDFRDFSLQISAESGAKTVADRPGDMALSTIPMELHAKAPATADGTFLGNCPEPTEHLANFFGRSLAQLVSLLEVQREYFLCS